MNVRSAAFNGRLENFLKEFHPQKITILFINASRESALNHPDFFRVFRVFRG
jgi:hypothetical protein